MDVSRSEAVVRQDAALLEDDLAAFLGALPGDLKDSVYAAALERSLYTPVADALGSKVGQQALAPATGAPGGRAPLRPSMVYWAYRNYRGFSEDPGSAGLAVIRRTAVAVRILLKAAVVLDDIQDDSVVRYGEPALHVTHGTPVALNTGSWLITAALRHVADPAVTDSLVDSVQRGFTGQAGDMATRSAAVRAELLAAPREGRVRFWESVAAHKTGTLFRMPLDAALAGLRVVEEERLALEEAMRRLGLASQLFNDLTDVVPEFGGANTGEDFDGLSNRVYLELLGPAPEGGARSAEGDARSAEGDARSAEGDARSAEGDARSAEGDARSYVLGHPRLSEVLLDLSAEAVELKRSAKELVHGVCRSEESAAYFDITIDRKGHLIDRLSETLRLKGDT